jgi:CubicO group peptidase (beta-lactamase class C family)
LVVHVEKAGRVLLSKGYGSADRARRTPAEPATPFPIGSITKTFTSALIYALADRGVLDLRKTIGVYLTDLPPWKDSVRIKDLLTHTSGLVEFWEQPGAGATRGTESASSDLIALFAPQPLRARPGTWYQYETSSWILLGALIEHATNRSYPDALREYVLQPLQLSHTSYCGSAAYPVSNARGYRWDEKGDSLIAGDMRGVIGTYTSGGICSSSRDLARFGAALLSSRLLSARSLADMTTPPEATTRFGNGAGIFVGSYEGHRLFTHSGSLRAGFQSDFILFPDDSLAIILLGNQYDTNLQAIRQDLTDAVLGIRSEAREVSLSADDVRKYVGRYPTGGSNRLIFFERDGQLQGMGTTMRYIGNDTFFPATDRSTRVVFTMASGRAVAMQVRRDGMVALEGRRADAGQSR